MARAIELARLGGRNTKSNPNVGSVIVFENKIIGEGYHEQYGQNHAERNAILNVSEENIKHLPFSTIYVTLEPCNHTGKTGPCAHFIVKNKIPNVVIACVDPNNDVTGGGLAYLKKNGVNVILGVLQEEGLSLIAPFMIHQKEKRPYVILKFAKSADHFLGKENKQIWLSNQLSKTIVHKWRTEVDGIFIGTNTSIIDNPKLTSRLFEGSHPIRIIIDKNLTVPSTNHLLSDAHKTIIFNHKKEGHNLNKTYIKWDFNQKSLKDLLAHLFTLEIYYLIVEGGANTIQRFIDADLWDEARIINTPKILENGIKAPNIHGVLRKKVVLNEDTIVWINKSNVKLR